MTKFSIEYNPYLVECVFKKNGKNLGEKSKIGAQSKKRLQVLLGESGNWRGLVKEIDNACNDRLVDLRFRGRKIDFDDLKYCIDRYKSERNTVFQLKFEESKNEGDIIRELDILFEEIKKKKLLQFEIKNEEGKNIFDTYEEAKNGIFEVSVIATMSSGKSTLINSLLHTELLPSENKACTATIARILDNDDMEGFEAECYAADEKTVIYPRSVVDADMMREYNSDERVQFIDIEGDVPMIPSEKIRLCLRDTPGPNNSRDENHGRLTNSIIKRTNAVVLYVMNATQIGIKDDQQLLKTIASEMKRAGKQSKDRFIFVINKCDALDEEKGETVDKLLLEVTDYLRECGIEEPTLIPTSARMALLVRKDRKGEKLTRQEKKELSTVEDFVESPLLHFETYATLTPTVSEKLRKKAEEYHADEETWDLEALIHSGVPAVEETIAEYIEKYAYPMKIKDAVKDTIRILDDLNMKAKFDQEIARDSKKLEKVREQIKEAKGKYADGSKIYEEYTKKIQNFRLDGLDEDDELFKIEMQLQNVTKKYDGKVSVDKTEADLLISNVQEWLGEFQRECENKLNREIDEKFFQKCNVMLDEYSALVMEILDEIKIEGYDFRRLSSFDKIRITNISDIKKKNEQVRYRNETRWKDNPERAGFWGFFKVWKPKQISYTVQVKDGINVNVRQIIKEVLSDFSVSIKGNVSSMFKQAQGQITEYKEKFLENIDNLDHEIKSILIELEHETAESEEIELRVEKNKEQADWVAEKEEKIRTLLTF